MDNDGDLSGLIKKIVIQNDKTAFARFFKLYHARMVRYALLFVYSYKDAEDIVSEVMINLLKQRVRPLKIGNPSGYLFSAIKNQAINHKKKNKSHQHIILEDIPKDNLTDYYVQPYESVLESELQGLVIKLIEELPPQRKLVYKLIKDEGLKIKEVSELLDIAEKTVKKHLELALKDLKNAIRSHYEEKTSGARIINITSKIS